MPFETVIVIGGGLAGLSAATALAESGLRVRLFEKKPHLGGRAASYILPDGAHVDNCQHVMLGCCTNLADFYRRVGAAEKIRFYDRLYFAGRRGRVSAISARALPPPFHLAPSFLFFDALSWSDKRAIASGLLRIARAGGRPGDLEGLTMLEWLRRHGQTDGAIRRFWRAVLVSALDEELDRADARYGADVFWKAFLANRAGFHLGIPAVPLGELYSGCREAIERRGGEVRTRATVREIILAGDQFASAVLDDGAEVRADAGIVAVPHGALRGILPAPVRENPALAGLARLRSSPITGVHLWFDRTVMDLPFLALLDHDVQWIFNKSLLYDSSRAAEGQYLQMVISASYDLVARSRQEIIALCLKELGEVLPRAGAAQVRKATVIKEVAATFSPEPGSDAWRPAQAGVLPRLFLAGDWTRTGWPATMEGAVRSGYLAAEAVLAAAGRPQKILQPDLPVEGFCGRWARRAAEGK